MEQQDHLRLVSTEVGALWAQYMSDTMARCVLQYFLKKVQDQEIKPVIEFALGLSHKHIESITQIFNNEGIAIPKGFSNSDVNLNAPPLYLDAFYLRYLRHSAKLALAAYGIASALAVRPDVREFYYACIKATVELNERVIQLQLTKGIFVRAPYIPIQRQSELVQSPSFAGSILGQTRPLNALSIMTIFPNIQTNAEARALLIGFSQVAQSEDVRDFMIRGADITKKHIEVLSTLLKNSELPAPATWESEVTDSIVPPFSDKLMMQHITTLIGAGMANYGAGLSAETRLDIGVDYMRLMAETAAFGEDGMHIMIKHGWLEQPPQAADRKQLALSR